MKQKIQIVAVDDHPVARLAVRNALADHIDLELVRQVDGPAALLSALMQHPCHILVMDLSMPYDGDDGLRLLRTLRRQYPELRIIVLSMYDSPALIRCALQIGAAAFVSKRDDITYLISAIRATMRGERYLAPRTRAIFDAAQKRCPALGPHIRLTSREAHVLFRYLDGESIAAIATSLGRSIKTISAQRSTAMRKLWVDNDAHLFEFDSFDGIRRPAATVTYGTESPSIDS